MAIEDVDDGDFEETEDVDVDSEPETEAGEEHEEDFEKIIAEKSQAAALRYAAPGQQGLEDPPRTFADKLSLGGEEDFVKIIAEKSQAATLRNAPLGQIGKEETPKTFTDKLRFGKVQLNTMQNQMMDLRVKVQSQLDISLWTVTDPVYPLKTIRFEEWLHETIRLFYDEELYSAADQAVKKFSEIVSKIKDLKQDYERLDAIQLMVVEQLLGLFKQQDDQIRTLEAAKVQSDAEKMQFNERITQMELSLANQKFAGETLRQEEKKQSEASSMDSTMTMLMGNDWKDLGIAETDWDGYKTKVEQRISRALKSKSKSMNYDVANFLRGAPQPWQCVACLHVYHQNKKGISERFSESHFRLLVENLARGYLEITKTDLTPEKSY